MRSRISSIRMFHAILLILFTLFFVLLLMRVRIYVVSSGSMEPEFPIGSVVAVDTWNRNPDVGEVLTFRQGSQIVTHRIVGSTAESFTTKGDANSIPDILPVPRQQAIGRVFLMIPLIGFPLLAIRSIYGICLLSLTVLFLFLPSILPFYTSQTAIRI